MLSFYKRIVDGNNYRIMKTQTNHVSKIHEGIFDQYFHKPKTFSTEVFQS